MAIILVAEDDESLRFFIQKALIRAGHTVKSVISGKQALHLLYKEPFDLLITDIAMPEMNGLELAQETTENWPSMPVIFITGFSAMAMKCRAHKAPMTLLSKPFHLNELIQQIDATLAAALKSF